MGKSTINGQRVLAKSSCHQLGHVLLHRHTEWSPPYIHVYSNMAVAIGFLQLLYTPLITLVNLLGVVLPITRLHDFTCPRFKMSTYICSFAIRHQFSISVVISTCNYPRIGWWKLGRKPWLLVVKTIWFLVGQHIEQPFFVAIRIAMAIWEVVGGVQKGGVLVRLQKDRLERWQLIPCKFFPGVPPKSVRNSFRKLEKSLSIAFRFQSSVRKKMRKRKYDEIWTWLSWLPSGELT